MGIINLQCGLGMAVAEAAIFKNIFLFTNLIFLKIFCPKNKISKIV
jgi:hypothetical protein